MEKGQEKLRTDDRKKIEKEKEKGKRLLFSY